MAQKHNSYEEKPMTRFGTVQGPSRRYRRLRNPTFPAAEWADKNPLLQRGEIGYEVDTHHVKVGDGVTYWNDLPYIFDDAGQPLSTADYQMGNAQGGWTTMSQAQQDALNSGANTTNIGQIGTNTTTIGNHIANTNNPHSVTASQVGLGNVDNTSDLDKPISTATQNALDGKVDKTTSTNKVYATDSSGGQTTISYSTTATNSTIVQRTSGQQVRVATTPVGDNDATSKKYVDDGLALKANSADLATVATTGEYSDLLNTPTIGNATLSIQKNGTTIDTFTANATSNKTINITVPVTAADVNALPDTTKYTASASMTIDSSTYVVTLQLKDQDGNNIGTAQTIDLPLETMVVSGSYDDATKKIILTLQNGQTIEFSVADLVSGLQTEITSNNMLDADLVDDSTSTNKFVTASDITNWNGKADGINRLNGAPLSNASSKFYGTSDSAATDVQKEVSIPSITSLYEGVFIIVQPTVTSTVANSTLKLNSFDAYPMFYNGVAITTSTDSVVWNLAYPSFWVFDGTHWVFAGHGLDSNTTYNLNYSFDAGQYKAGTGTRVITRYSLILQKDDGTWEKPTNTSTNYTTATTKTVNPNGFLLNQIKYYGTTTNIGTGAFTAANVVYSKAASVDLAYSCNCGTAPAWALGDYIYLVGSMGVDGLFYLDTTTWWSNALPTTNDGKLYIRLGHVLTADVSKISFYDERPIFYHDGVKLCEYNVADNKQDKLTAGSNITISGSTISATDTTYTGSDGITLTGTNFTNSGVRSVASGTANGTISVNTNGTSADVAVTGLCSAAYTASTDYATSAQGAKADTAVQPGDLATVATSGSYNDLLNKPTISTVNDATLTIQKNGTDVSTFTANASSNVTANITVPTDTNDLTNGAGYITGINSTDVTTALGYTPVDPSTLATVATSGDYDDLLNKPTIPAAQVNSDWDANSGVAEILNKPSLATVATSGSYNDLSDKPTIPTVNDATLTIQKNGTNVATFTANSATATTANITVPTDTNDLTNGAGYITGITSSDVTTALGYTPYSDANPNGYTSNVGTVTSVNNTSPDGSGNVSLTIPTVNNPTITITQGGVTKGSFTLNQASGDTIALDAGGGGGSLPSQTGHAGEFLTTDGTDASWQGIKEVPDTTGASVGDVLTVDGYGDTVWQSPLPDQTGHGGEFLYTDGSDAYWAPTDYSDMIDYVVAKQEPTAGNNYTWYRKYKSGWVEQGGTVTSNSNSYDGKQVNLPIEMADTTYQVQKTLVGGTTGNSGLTWLRIADRKSTENKGTTYVSLSVPANSYCLAVDWEVKGMAA